MFYYYLLIFLILLKTIYSSEPSCLVLVNNRIHDSNKTLLITNDQVYHLAFGSFNKDNKNIIVGYSIDVRCNLNSTYKSHYYYDIKYLPIEINVLNCSQDLTFKNIALYNNGTIDFFLFEARLLKSNISDLNVNLTINRRYGNGCSASLYFTKNLSFKDQILYKLSDIWLSIRSNYICFLIMVLLVATLTILTILTVTHIGKYFKCEKKQIQINVPSIKFIKTSKNIKFDSLSHLTETNNPSIVETLDTNETLQVSRVQDESTQADVYNAIREQFNTNSSKRNAAFQQ